VVEDLETGEDPDVFEHIAGAAELRLRDRDRLMYANGGYYVLGEVIEAVDGRPYGRYARETVLEPLGMERSSFDAESLRTDGEAMTGYALEDGEFTERTYEGGAGPSGGLLSTPRELARLGRTVLGEGAVDGTRVLDREHAHAAHSLQSPPVPTVDGSERGYGYGWEIGEFADQHLVGHLGGIEGAGAYLGVLPDADLGVAVAYNRWGPPGVTIGLGVLAIALGEDPADLVRMIRVSDAVEESTGTYRAYRDAESLTVESGPAGTIQLSLENGMSFTASPDEIEADRYLFSTRPGNGTRWTVEFLRTDAGTRVVLSMGKWTTAFSEA
jgi:CubicO group peptidase (beta-lactamase class C family)